jgi:hypothetical protein
MAAATTTRRSPTASGVATVLLCLGLVVLTATPLSCGTEPEEASEPEASQTTEANTDRAILLNVGVEDGTKDRPPSDDLLLEPPSGERWTPGILDGGGATNAFEKHPIGESRTLRLYPQGEDGQVLEIPITMKPDMSSVLASSRTDIFVYDDSIVVSGPAVPDKRITFDRPAPSTDS